MMLIRHWKRATSALEAGAREALQCWRETAASDHAIALSRRLDAAVASLQEPLVDAKKGVAISIATEKRLTQEHARELAAVLAWEARARMAAAAGQETLAAEAADRKREHERIAAALSAAVEEKRSAVAKLRDQLVRLHVQLEDATRRKNALVARATHVSASISLRRLARALERVERTLRELERA